MAPKPAETYLRMLHIAAILLWPQRKQVLKAIQPFKYESSAMTVLSLKRRKSFLPLAGSGKESSRLPKSFTPTVFLYTSLRRSLGHGELAVDLGLLRRQFSIVEVANRSEAPQ
jgi:hypothetical protein